MSAWVPSDDELDALARGAKPAEPGTDRAEQIRTRVLAAAGTTRQVAHSAWPKIAAAIAIPLVAAAALVIWLRTHPADEVERVAIAGTGHYTVAGDWPDRTIELTDGTLTIAASSLTPDRFHVRAPDGEAVTDEATFEIAVAHGHLDAVTVSAGRVELRVANQQAIFLAAGQSWHRTLTAQRDSLPLPEPAPKPPEPPRPIDPAPPSVPAKPAPKRAPPRIEAVKPDSPPVPEVAKPEPKPQPEQPGEADFRAGMTALRGGDFGTATRSFTAACAASKALAEDACFWIGAAARRAGQTSTARTALASFLARFPASARAGEAAALLGWILLEAGDLDGAEQRFQQAAADRVPSVRDSAARGLTAIQRKRH